VQRFAKTEAETMSRKTSLRKKLIRIFNEFIRLRDSKLACISCRTRPVQQAGHFHSTGKCPQPAMRFNEENVNGQCVYCNYTLGGNPDGYKKGIVEKYGKGIIRKLDIKRSVSQNPWTDFEYVTMIGVYKKKLDYLKFISE
jgi:hypothetical protein